MGRAIRWLKSLLGGKKEKKKETAGDSQKEKERSSFGKLDTNLEGCGNVGQTPTAADSAWLRSYYSEREDEQSKHAIAVAAATAAAADAAVAAAQAAVAVVRLTSHGRGTMFAGSRERWAAVKIQTAFRGYLAKKALRALKGLVKLQARVRGYLVRRQAAETLHSMQALMRAQATVRRQKAILQNEECRFQPDIGPRRSTERSDDTRSEHATSIHSRRLSASLDTPFNIYDENPKIVEIDTFRPKSRSRRTNTSISDCAEDALSSPLPCHISAHHSASDYRNVREFGWGLTGDECRFTTAQSTPRFTNSGGLGAGIPVTPTKSICSESFFHQYSDYPSYMANTQSSRAKLRSHSAPKQRPVSGPKKKLLLNEMVESRTSLSGVQMQRSCSQAQEPFNFKNAVMGRLYSSTEFVKEPERENFRRKVVRSWVEN